MRWIILLVFTCGCGTVLDGQISYQERIQIAKASSEDRNIQITELRDILEDSNINSHADTVGLIHYAIAFRYRILEDHLKVIDYSKGAIEAFEKSKHTGYQNTFSLSFLGESYAELNQDKESLDAYFGILKINPEGRDFDVYGYAVNEIARKLIQYEDYESAIPVIDQFLSSSYREQIPLSDLIRVLLSASIANSNLKGADHQKKAQSTIVEAEELYSLLEEDSDLWISIDMQKAALSLFMDEPNASTKYQDLLNELSNNNPVEDNLSDARTMLAFNASYAFQKIGDFRKGLEMATLATQQFDHFGNRNHIENEYLIYDNLATAHLGLFQLDSAHYYVDKGIGLFPAISQVKPSNRKFLLNLLYDQARIFYVQREENQKALKSALSSLYELDKLLDLHIAEQVSEYSINNLRNLGLKYYQLAIDISYALYDQNSFWYFSEKTKGLQLLKSHSQRRNAEGTKRQQSTIDSLKRSIVILETEMLKNRDTPSTNELESTIISKRAQIVVLQREVLNTDLSIEPYGLPTMIDVLDREELVLQYQYGQEDLYLQVVSNAGSVLKRVSNADTINTNILKIREMILDSKIQISDIENVAYSLYQTLLGGSLSDRSELFIIPDRELFFLPFEILSKGPREPYLIENYDVSYLPSGSFKLIGVDNDNVEVITVYKPNYVEGSLVNSPLPFINREIASIQTVFDTDLINQEEHPKSFLETLSLAQVMHFGGHAIIDGSKNDQSYLALGNIDGEESRLRLGELYTTSCVSELITLSACNTGMGGIIDGEGVSSITRGFLYAGARSVVNTLWTVDDQSTSNIVGLFYNYLSQGKSKSHSLRMAKLEYLKTAESYQRHPYYWAGIIGMGDMSQPIVYPTNWPKVFLTIAIFVILAWFLTWRFNEKPMRKIEFLTDWEELVNDRKIK